MKTKLRKLLIIIFGTIAVLIVLAVGLSGVLFSARMLATQICTDREVTVHVDTQNESDVTIANP